MELNKEIIKAYALENAIKYKGKANQGAVLAGLFSHGLEKSKIKEYIKIINEVIKEVNSLELNEQKKEFELLKDKVSKREIREGLPELKNVQGKNIVMRFAPFPSGPLHIGNSRTLILNDEYAKKYSGELLLVIDDTIGSDNKPIVEEAYELIEQGVKWLECKYNKVIYKSDRNEIYYKYCLELLKKQNLYVCECDRETMRKNKEQKKECKCRNLEVNEQIKRWELMFDKEKSPEGSFTVRLKTNMADPDPAFRDRVMFKISDKTHPRTKNKYRVYPTMEFSWAIDNYLLKITHIIRGVELTIETRVENFIRNLLGWTNPEIIYNGHLILEGVKISKSKGSKEVKSGQYIGWNDPRLWSLQSLESRGIKPQAIREFIIKQGIKKSNTTVPIDVLYSINKKFIEDSKRYYFVKNPKKINIKNAPEIKAKIPLHPEKDFGFKEYQTKNSFFIDQDDYNNLKQENFRLMHLFNFKAIKQKNEIDLEFLSLEPDNKLKAKMIHWVSADNEFCKIKVFMPNGEIINGYGEEKLKDLKKGEIIQFERFGFVSLTKKQNNELEFFFAHK